MNRVFIALPLLLAGCQPEAPLPVAVAPSAPPRTTPTLAPLRVVQSSQSSLPPVPAMTDGRAMPPKRVRRAAPAQSQAQSGGASAAIPLPGARLEPRVRSLVATPMNELPRTVAAQGSGSDRALISEIVSKIRNATSADEMVLLDMNLERAQRDPAFAGFSSPQPFRLSALRSATTARENSLRSAGSINRESSSFDLTSEMYISMALK